jgi:SAM-dependent MidA family methyltransferase
MAGAPPPLDAEESRRSAVVVERLRAAAGADGFLPFDRFMEIALYSEDVGFYDRGRSPLGPTGDFYTASHVHPLFAETLADRIRAVRAAVTEPDAFRVVELGPGDGALAEALTASFARDGGTWEYVLVERATARARDAEERTAGGARTVRVRRSESLAAMGPITGAVVANEFLDAQPARRLRWHDGVWHELGVRVADGRVRPAEAPVSRTVPGAPLPPTPESGLVVEFSPAAEATVREIADHVADGAALLIDYGFDESELLRSHPEGTLAAVRRHRFVADPFDVPGTADLSTFVNFSRIRAAATAGGLSEVAYRSQAQALGAWGFEGRYRAALAGAESAETKVRMQLAAKNLLFGFDRFRVLEVAPARTAAALAPAT